MRLAVYESNLDRLFSEVAILDDSDVIKAHLTRYLCVRTSGYLEFVIRYLITELCDGTSHRMVSNFVQQRSRYITNLTFNKLHDLLREFDQTWAEDFTRKVSDRQRAAINSVVANRNNIAHGNPDSTSFREMSLYYKDIREVAEILKNIIKK